MPGASQYDNIDHNIHVLMKGVFSEILPKRALV